MVFNNNLLMGAAGQASGYEIDQSVRFNDLDSAFLARTPSASNRKTWTWSAWVKRSNLFNGSVPQILLSAGDGGANDFVVQFGQSDDTLRISDYISGTASNLITTQLFRDVGAWYSLILAYDTTQGTAANRIKLYVNGSQVTAFGTETNPSLNADLVINSAIPHNIGRGAYSSNGYFSGYIAEINFVDGTALAPTAFGETNNDGVWIPVSYSGSYGTNGYYLTGADSTALGEDVRISGDQVISYAASQYTGATGSYTYSNGRLEADSANKAIKTVDTFAGDFEFSWRYVNMANFVIGVYETGEDGTFSDSSSAGNMQNMTDSWYIQTSSVAANRDIFYGGAVQVNATTIANGDTWKMTRSSGTIKLIRNGSDVHTFSQTSTNTVRIVVAQGDAAADAEQVAWVDNSTLGNNFFSTGMTTADQMSDTPTLNKATFNPLQSGVGQTLSDGNLVDSMSGTSGFWNRTMATQSLTYKTYWEIHVDTYYALNIGISRMDNSVTGQNAPAGLFGAGLNNNEAFVSGSYVNESSGGRTFPVANGNYIMLAYDPARNALWMGNEGTWKDGTGSSASSSTILSEIEGTGTSYAIFTGIGTEPVPFVGGYSTNKCTARFSSGDWEGTVPTGYEELSTAFIATPTIEDGSKYFQPVLYTGTTSAFDVTFSGNSDLAPDWLWFKARSAASNHFLFDKVRGALKTISSDTTAAEATSTGSMTAFGTDGFSLGDGGSNNDINGVSGTTYVAWGWAAGNSTGSTNDDGSVDSTVTANTTAGFSVVKYTPGTGAQTWGHGLGVAPKMVIVKEIGQAVNWQVYHESSGAGGKLFLNTTAAYAADTGIWNNTAPTSSVVSTGTGINTANPFIAYCFAEISGYSSFGSYTGNGSATDGPFVYTGFKPAFVMYKRTNATESWEMYDTTRLTYNPYNANLKANLSNAETNDLRLDILSNGFKARSSNTAINASGSTYIYMAFAEHPFGGDGVAPATAR